MPRTSSSKKATSGTNSSSSADLFRSASSKAATKEVERIDQIFHSYATKSSGIIDPDGIVSLCSALGVDYTNVRVLMLAWKMQAERQGYFTLDEWRRGLRALKADTMTKLKKALPELEKEVDRPSVFVDFYTYVFQYNLTEERQKTVDVESICLLLDLVLASRFSGQVDLLIQYLKIQTEYKVINMDQWMAFYRFCNEITFPSLSNYDENQAWPLILDSFVDWMKETRG